MGMAEVEADVYDGNNVLVASTNIVFAQPLDIVLASYSGHQTFDYDPPTEYDNIDWFINSGGILKDTFLATWNFLQRVRTETILWAMFHWTRLGSTPL